MSGNFGGFSTARGRNRWGYKNPFLFPPRTFTNKNLTDRNRYINFPIGGATVRTGTPTLALQGTNTKYRAWSFANAAIGEIVIEAAIPSDLASLLASVIAPSVSFQVYWTNLGAGSGNVRWEADYTIGPGNLNASTETAIFTVTAAAPQDLLALTSITSTMMPSGTGRTMAIVTLRRKGTDATDTLANAAGVVGLTLTYSADM